MRYRFKMKLIRRLPLVCLRQSTCFSCFIGYFCLFTVVNVFPQCTDIFKPDPNFLDNEKRYEDMKKDLLGETSDDEEGSDAGSGDEDDSEEEEEEEDEEQMKIKDETETNLVNLRRTIYLTIMSSVDFEEAGHKLLKIKLEPGQEVRIINKA